MNFRRILLHCVAVVIALAALAMTSTIPFTAAISSDAVIWGNAAP